LHTGVRGEKEGRQPCNPDRTCAILH